MNDVSELDLSSAGQSPAGAKRRPAVFRARRNELN